MDRSGNRLWPGRPLDLLSDLCSTWNSVVSSLWVTKHHWDWIGHIPRPTRPTMLGWSSFAKARASRSNSASRAETAGLNSFTATSAPRKVPLRTVPKPPWPSCSPSSTCSPGKPKQAPLVIKETTSGVYSLLVTAGSSTEVRCRFKISSTHRKKTTHSAPSARPDRVPMVSHHRMGPPVMSSALRAAISRWRRCTNTLGVWGRRAATRSNPSRSARRARSLGDQHNKGWDTGRPSAFRPSRSGVTLAPSRSKSNEDSRVPRRQTPLKKVSCTYVPTVTSAPLSRSPAPWRPSDCH
mmetsp:Transcript_36289/g.95181  ORF Transcript_36289/g.95181 Transcript_36289/m.95181 type:complete len:295 (-) Transcript_36289:1052-1936(-)